MAKITSIAAVVVAGFISLGNLLVSPVLAAAACSQWDLRDVFLRQGNFIVDFSLEESGGNLQGQARWLDATEDTGWPLLPRIAGHHMSTMHGPADGSINGNQLQLTVFWADGTVGAYSGVIGPTGRIEGTTYDKRNPSIRAQWHSQERIHCLVSASATPSEPPPSAPPNKVLGKKKAEASKAIGKAKKQPAPVTEVETSDALNTDERIELPSEGDDTACRPGFVWRLARSQDLVCVTPKAKARTAKENKRAAKYRDPDGAYGPNSCIEGYVWREAFEGDSVCVPPDIRDVVRQENSLGPSRRVGG